MKPLHSHLFTFVSTAAIAIVLFASNASAQPVMKQPSSKQSAATKVAPNGYVEVRGIKYHYEIRGKGSPLLLLHGGLGQRGSHE